MKQYLTKKFAPAGWLDVECNWINLIGFVFWRPSQDYFLTKKMEKMMMENTFTLEEAEQSRAEVVSPHLQHKLLEISRDLRYERGSQREGWSWQDLASYQEFYKNSFKSFHWEAKCAKSSGAKHRNINKIIWSSIQFSLIATTRLLKSWWTLLDRIIVNFFCKIEVSLLWHEITEMLF